MKKLFHVSLDYEDNIDIFIPRIPQLKSADEDNIQIRICVSDSIEGCLRAHPTFNYYFIEYAENKYSDPYEDMSRLAYIKNIDKVGILIKVYEFTINNNTRIKSNKDIIKEKLVYDAHLTNESWILEKIKPSDYKYILITDAENYEYIELGKNVGEVVNYLDRYDYLQQKRPYKSILVN